MRSNIFSIVIIALTFVTRAKSLRRSDDPDAGSNSPQNLNELAQARGKLWFGTAADVPGAEQQDVGYMTILNDTNIFGQLTPANYMKV